MQNEVIDLSNTTIVRNILWKSQLYADYFVPYFIPSMLTGVLSTMIICTSAKWNSSLPSDRIRNDAMLHTFLASCQFFVLWLYTCATTYFVSFDMQIAMIILIFSGPQLLAMTLLPYKTLFSLWVESSVRFRTQTLEGFGLGNVRDVPWDSISGILAPIGYIVVNILVVIMLVLGFLISGIVVLGCCVGLGFFSLSVLLVVIREFPLDDDDRNGELNLNDLITCVLFHFVALSIPLLVMVNMNMNLNIPGNDGFAGAAITFHVLFGFECLFAVFYGVKWIISWRDNLKSTRTPSPSTTEQSNSDGIYMVRAPFPTVQRTNPTTKPTFTQETDYPTSSKSWSNKQDDIYLQKMNYDDDDDDDLEEPNWNNVSRYSTVQRMKLENDSFQNPTRTSSSNANGENDTNGSFTLECRICFGSGNRKKLIVNCGHMLCENCLYNLQVRDNSKVCPFCQQKFNLTADVYF